MDMIARLCEHVVVMTEGRRLAEGSFAGWPPIRGCRRPTWGSAGGRLDGRGMVAGYSAADDILKGVTSVDAGEIVCVIGPNGAGKSTLAQGHRRAAPAERRPHPPGDRPSAAARRARSAASASPWCRRSRNLPHHVRAREPRDGRVLEPATAAGSSGASPLSRARRSAASRAHAVGRPAPDAGHGHGADGRAAGCSSTSRRRDCRRWPPSSCSRRSRPSTATASRSPWWSRTLEAWRSPIERTSSSTAATTGAVRRGARRRSRHQAALPGR